MITAVLDTNVLASGFVRSNPAAAPVQLIDAWRANVYQLVVSEYILTELARTFDEPYFRRRLTSEQMANDLQLLRRQAVITLMNAHVSGVATHPEDDPLLATAISAKAQYLVTGDDKLRELRAYRGVTIASPREFLDTLQAEGGASR